MDPLSLLEHFRYIALFVAAFFEMETVVLLAAYFAVDARFGFTTGPIVAVTFIGAFVGHIFFFWLGRTQGVNILHRFPHLHLHAGKAERFFTRHGTLTIFLSQYLIGLRIPLAIMIGISNMRWRKFLPLQLLSCLLWAVLCTVAGVFFGNTIRALSGRRTEVEIIAVCVLVAIAGVLYLVHRHRDHHLRAS